MRVILRTDGAVGVQQEQETAENQSRKASGLWMSMERKSKPGLNVSILWLPWRVCGLVLYGSRTKNKHRKIQCCRIHDIACARKQRRDKPLGSKYLVGLPSGLRIDILSKGSFVSTSFTVVENFAESRRQMVDSASKKVSCVCREGVSETEERREGGGVENQNTRSGPVSRACEDTIRDSAMVTTHPKVGPCRRAGRSSSKADWPTRGRGTARFLTFALRRARLVRSRMLRPVREHCAEALQELARRYAGASPEAQPGIGNLEVSEHPCSVTSCLSQEGSSLLVETMRAEASRLDAPPTLPAATSTGMAQRLHACFFGPAPERRRKCLLLASIETCHHGGILNITLTE